MASSTVPPIGARLRAARRNRGISVRGLAREIGVSASLISQIETEKSSPSVSTLYAITTALAISIEDLFGEPAPNVAAAAEVEEDETSDERDAAVLAALDPVPAAAAGPISGTGTAVGVAMEAALAAALRTGAAVDADTTGRMGGAGRVGSAGGAGGPAGDGGNAQPGRERRIGPVVTPNTREVLTLDSGVTWELLGQIPHKHVDFLLITYQPGGSSSGSGLLMRHSGTEFGYVISGELTLTLGFQTHRLAAGDSVSFDSSTPHAYRNESTEPAVGVWFVLERST